jgi:hypothetical protein
MIIVMVHDDVRLMMMMMMMMIIIITNTLPSFPTASSRSSSFSASSSSPPPPSRHCPRDVALLGGCDEGVTFLSERLGWAEDLKAIMQEVVPHGFDRIPV